MKFKKIIATSLVFILSLTVGFSVANQSRKILHADEVKKTTANYNSITSIKLNKASLTISGGKKSVITASVTYGKDTSLSNEPYNWTSKDSGVATVDKTGKIKAVKPGETYIICSSQSGNVKARCKVSVHAPYNTIKSIKLSSSELQLDKKGKRKLTPIISYGKKTQYAAEPLLWSSSNNKIVTVKNGVLKGKKNGTAYISVKSKYTNKSAKCKVIVKNVKYIAITFDDGPGEYTDKLLNALEKNHSKATFFVLGNRANAYKKQLKREAQLGMEIGSHTYSHQNLKTLSKKKIKSEIFKTRDAVKKVTGSAPTLLRPPYGNYNSTVSKNAGVPMIYWSVDTEDWKHRNANYISKYIVSHAGDGEIVLLHDIHPTSVDGFIKALPKLRKKGYELVTVSELYAIKGKNLKKGVMYFGPNRDK